MLSIQLSGLTHEFDSRTVFDSIDFEFDGRCLAVTGPNGSGKSTLLRIMSGLLTPSSGEARLTIDGVATSHDRLRDVVGLAAPGVRLYEELTALENIRFVLSARGLSPRLAEAALEMVGLGDRANDAVSELSSGLYRRACLAAAIAHDPPLLLLDEPESNLDEAGRSVVDAIVERWRERGMVVIATNDPAEAARGEARLDLGGRQ